MPTVDVSLRASASLDAAPARPPVSFEVVRDAERLEALADVWRERVAAGRFFSGPDWTLAWLRHARADVTPHVVVGRDADGRVAAVLPLARRRDGALTTCGAEHGLIHADVVAVPGHERVAADGALACVARERPPRVRLERLAEDGALLAAVRGGAWDGPRLERVATTAPYVAGAEGWEGFRRTLSRHQRHEMDRQSRRFWERSGARIRVLRTAAECAEGIDVLFDLHERRSAVLERESRFDRTTLRDLHVDLARRLAADGRLLLALLEEGGRPVAAAYGFHEGSTTLLFQTGIDPAFHAAGAGVVLRSVVLRDEVLGAGRTELDLLDGCYAWKARWASGVRVLLDVDLRPATASGRARGGVARVLAGARRAAAKTIKGVRCPGLPAGEEIDATRCARLGCRFAADAARSSQLASPPVSGPSSAAPSSDQRA